MSRVRRTTEHQIDLLRVVEALRLELGRFPTASDVARKLGISRYGASKQLHRLEERGLLADVPVVVSSGQWGLTDAARRALGDP